MPCFARGFYPIPGNAVHWRVCRTRTLLHERICGAGGVAQFSRFISELVQENHHRVSDRQPCAAPGHRPLRHRMDTDRRVYFHPGAGPALLSPATRGTPGPAGGGAGHDPSANGLSRGAGQLRGHPAVDVHGGRHLFYEGAAAVRVYAHPAAHSLQTVTVAAVQFRRRLFVRLPRRADGNRRADQRRRGFLHRVPQGRFRQGRASRRARSRRR